MGLFISSGFGTYLRTIRWYTPTGTAADAANINALIAETANVGELVITAGSALITSPLSILSGTNLYGIPGATRLVASMVPSGDVNQAIFSALSGTASPGSTTVAAPNTFGGLTVQLTGAPAGLPVGTAAYYRAHPTSVIIRDTVTGSGFQGSTYRVISVDAGALLTVDRPVWVQLGIGDAVTVCGAVNENVHIAGFTLSGTATRLVEHIGTRNHVLENLVFDAADGWPTDIVASFDTFGYENRGTDWRVFAPGTDATTLVAIESQERTVLELVSVHDGAYNGIVAFDAWECVLQDCDAFGCVNAGLGLTADGNLLGCLNTRVRGGNFNRNTALGIDIANGSRGCRFEGVVARGNATNLNIGDPGSAVTGTWASGVFREGSTGGIVVASTATRTQLESVDVSGSAIGLNLGAGTDCQVRGFLCGGAVGTYAIYSAATFASVDGFVVNPTSAINVVYVPSGKLSLRNGVLSGGAGSNLVNVIGAAATVEVEDLVATVVGGIALYPTGTVKVGDGVDLSGAGTPITLVANGKVRLASQGGYFDQAMADANQTPTWAGYASEVIECTGAMTNQRNLVLPSTLKGYVWTVKNSTTGGQNVQAIGAAGTGVVIAPGAVARVWYDGTNFVAG